MLNVGRRTYFKAGSAVLDGTAKVTLDKQANWLNRNTDWKIKVQGFADDPGSDTTNVELSRKRAAAVRDYLVSKGVDHKTLVDQGLRQETHRQGLRQHYLQVAEPARDHQSA